MEIKGLDRPAGMTRLTPSKKIEDNTPFREVLQLRISQTNPACSAGGAESKAAFLEQGGRVLDLLDDFAQALADPQKTLKDLEPLMVKMETEAEPLESVPGSEGDSDQGLPRLLGDVSVLAHVAAMKFRRGDYL
ncbi:MAG: hypothetical protein MUC98_12270 [Desulfobacterota bacterium]|jgi:hypothetical protein|nr:hypothetical protein [Thermodesulfobacteriota bacterium]